MTTPFKSNGLALLIGINDYSTYAAATGNPPDAINLKGGAHDTVAIERCSRDLGMLAENIRVLRNDIASPGNDGKVPSKIGEDGRPLLPTREEILRQIGWLRAQLEGSEERHGLLWYSGHSAHTSKDGLLLCPSDTGKDFANAIPFKELGELLGPAAAKRLTVVLDCCHGGALNTTDGKRASTLGGDPIEPTAWIDDADLRIGAVVLAACAPGELAQQSWFAGIPHGAFTWALLCVANQWIAKQQGDSTRMTLTYRQLVKRATALLSSLDFEQTPQIWPQPAGALTVLQTGNQNESADDHPDGSRGHIQIDGGSLDYKVWSLHDAGNSIIGWILVANNEHQYTAANRQTYTYAAGNVATEYWNMAAWLAAGSTTTALSFVPSSDARWTSGTSVAAFSNGTFASFPQAMSGWNRNVSFPPSMFLASDAAVEGNGGVDFSGLSYSTSTGRYSGQIVWWLLCPTGSPPSSTLPHIVGGQGATYAHCTTPTPTSGLSWYSMSQTVTDATFSP